MTFRQSVHNCINFSSIMVWPFSIDFVLRFTDVKQTDWVNLQLNVVAITFDLLSVEYFLLPCVAELIFLKDCWSLSPFLLKLLPFPDQLLNKSLIIGC